MQTSDADRVTAMRTQLALDAIALYYERRRAQASGDDALAVEQLTAILSGWTGTTITRSSQ